MSIFETINCKRKIESTTHKKQLRLENARPQLRSTIPFKMDIDQKERRPLNGITFKIDLDRM